MFVGDIIMIMEAYCSIIYVFLTSPLAMFHHIAVAFPYVCSTVFAVPLMYYGLQHYLSLVGSVVFIPLIIVPAMGGTDVSIFFMSFFGSN